MNLKEYFYILKNLIQDNLIIKDHLLLYLQELKDCPNAYYDQNQELYASYINQHTYLIQLFMRKHLYPILVSNHALHK